MEHWLRLSCAETQAIHALAFLGNEIDDICMSLSVETLQGLSHRIHELERMREMNEREREALSNVVKYLWADEIKHFECEGKPDGHICCELQVLQDYLADGRS